MVTNTSMTFLMVAKSGEIYEKLVDITDFPDIGDNPQMLDATTLSDDGVRQIAGINNANELEFGYNYDKETYKKISELKGTTTKFAIYLGGTSDAPTGDLGMFKFSGQISTYMSGGSVNEVRKAKLKIAVSSKVEFSAGA